MLARGMTDSGCRREMTPRIWLFLPPEVGPFTSTDNQDLAEFVMATIIWGYPCGMRGNNVASLIRDFDALISLLAGVCGKPVGDWGSHGAQLASISGVGLSTYTKFLTFLSVAVHGHTALILDDRIIRIAQSGIFQELAPLHELKNAARSYPRYLECMHRFAGDLVVSAERLEFFSL
jgi:8-oxoguanine DNA glycosylase-like protein